MRIAMLVTVADVESPFFSIDIELDNISQQTVLARLAKEVVELIREDGYVENTVRRETEQQRALENAVLHREPEWPSDPTVLS